MQPINYAEVIAQVSLAITEGESAAVMKALSFVEDVKRASQVAITARNHKDIEAALAARRKHIAEENSHVG